MNDHDTDRDLDGSRDERLGATPDGEQQAIAEHAANPVASTAPSGAREEAPSPAAADTHHPPSAEPREAQVFIPRITIGAFVRDPGIRKTLSQAAADRRMMRASVEVAEGDIETASERYRREPTPDLVIVETRQERPGLFQALESLAEHCPPGTRLIVVGHENDVRLYRELLKSGVGDYLVAPIDAMATIDAIAQLFSESEAERLGKVVAFLGARGGAGSSTVAQNTAAAMASRCQASVLLVDLDLNFGTAALDLNLEPAQGVHDALQERERLDETLLDRFVTSRDERLGVLTAPCQLDQASEYDAETLGHLIETARAITPHLLLDLPHSWSEATRQALLGADEIVLTATPDLAALRNARNIAAAARTARQNDPAPRLVLNKLGVPKRKEISPADFQNVVELEPAAQIPHDPVAFSAASASGEPVAESRSNAAAAEAFASLARLLTGQRVAQPATPAFTGWARWLIGRT